MDGLFGDLKPKLLRSREAYANNVWDFGIFDGCFGHTNIVPTDIDCIVERNGHFLVLEFKPSVAELPLGQELLLKQLAGLSSFTVAVVGCHGPGKPYEFAQVKADAIGPVAPMDLEGLRRRVSKWFLRISTLT